jgi:hypothetical protein
MSPSQTPLIPAKAGTQERRLRGWCNKSGGCNAFITCGPICADLSWVPAFAGMSGGEG